MRNKTAVARSVWQVFDCIKMRGVKKYMAEAAKELPGLTPTFLVRA